jgi:transcriptional regulator with XRE-family HTH domain
VLEQRPVAAVVVANVRALRRARGWSVEQVAVRLQELGLDWRRNILANLESGRRADVTVDELDALGRLFGVQPWSLAGTPVCTCCGGAPPAGFRCLQCGAG